MARTEKIGVELIDVDGSFRRMVTLAPKLARKLMSTAIFTTVSKVRRDMEANAPEGPDGEGLTPGTHIKLEITDNWKANKISALVGILGKGDNPDARVALFNEFSPNSQPFMRPAARANDSTLLRTATEALRSLEKKLEDGARD